MKHGALLTEEELAARLRSQLDASEIAKLRLAAHLGIGQGRLTNVLRGRAIGPKLAEALGYRKVVRFERVREDESCGAAFPRRE